MLLKNLCLLFVLFLRAACDQGHLFRRNSTGLTDAVTWDRNSLFVQGQRIFVLSAEFHPWRLPNPDLWLDVFQKIRANGFNTVSFIVSWTLHYPTPGTNGTQGDFEPGTFRDIQRFIDGAKEAGLWLIARYCICFLSYSYEIGLNHNNADRDHTLVGTHPLSKSPSIDQDVYRC